jgi:hypothetical protein
MSPTLLCTETSIAFEKAAAASNASSLPMVIWKRPRGSAAPVNSTTILGENRWATSAVPCLLKLFNNFVLLCGTTPGLLNGGHPPPNGGDRPETAGRRATAQSGNKRMRTRGSA